MPNDHTPDLENEGNIASEYGLAMATAAESLLKYHGRMQGARSEDERAYIRAEHVKLVKKVVKLHSIAIAAMTANKPERTWFRDLAYGLAIATFVIMCAFYILGRHAR